MVWRTFCTPAITTLSLLALVSENHILTPFSPRSLSAPQNAPGGDDFLGLLTDRIPLGACNG